jgi:predicted HTH transcriptional regulator
MAFVLFVVIMVAIFLAVGWLTAYQEAKRKGIPTGKEFEGLYYFTLEQTLKRRANQQKILDFMKEKGEVNNSDLRELLNISRNSIVRYMDDLEKKGKVEQVGNTGQGVTYHLK